MADTLDMSEKHKLAVAAAMESGRSIEQAEAYVFAVREFMHTVVELTAIGVAPSERRDALGHSLLDQLTYHYSEEQAFLWAEEFLAMLKRRYDAAKSPTSIPPPY